MFRRECFEAIGGYSPVRSGGVDLIAVLSARAKGWETRTFTERSFVHHRSQNSALHAGLRERIHMGRKDYMLGNHPVWEIFRSVYQMKYRPYGVGGLVLLGSYAWNLARRVERSIPAELMAIRRDDQMKRLTHFIRRRFRIAAPIA
jgi:biofilm PGA synthesis N-glycosyltransferase PgaC